MGSTELSGSGRRVAVLGGTGFLGRPVCRTLANHGYEVVAVARHAATFDHPVTVRPLDLATSDSADIARVFAEEGVTAVINAAGGMWGLTDEQMVGANRVLVQHVIDAAATLPHPVRLVQLGSVHEYGLVPIGDWMDEDTPPEPVNAYSRLKLECTDAVVEASEQGRIDGVSLRIGNAVGGGQPRASLLGVVAEQLHAAQLEQRTAQLSLGPLGSQRDFLCLSDAVAAIMLAVSIPTLPARVFNIGSGGATSARRMVELLIEVSGVPTELSEAEAPGGPELVWQQMRIDRARRLLGWSPHSDLSDGMKELWEHQVESARA